MNRPLVTDTITVRQVPNNRIHWYHRALWQTETYTRWETWRDRVWAKRDWSWPSYGQFRPYGYPADHCNQ